MLTEVTFNRMRSRDLTVKYPKRRKKIKKAPILFRAPPFSFKPQQEDGIWAKPPPAKHRHLQMEWKCQIAQFIYNLKVIIYKFKPG